MENQKIDLVIPFGKGFGWKEGLRYVLRSWAKNYDNLGHVFLVGDESWIKSNLPWLKGVKIVNCDDPFSMNKDGNIIRKVIKVIDTQELTDPFIRTSDDHYLLKKIDSFPPMHTGDLNEKSRGWWNIGRRWKNRLKRTHRILFVKKKTVFNYDGHFPMEVRHDFKRIMETYPYTKSIGYTINTLYYNNAIKEHVYYDDCRVFFAHPVHDEKKIKDRMKGKKFMCYSGRDGKRALTPALKAVIMNKFKIKSRFEK